MPSKQVEDVYNAGGFDGGPLGKPGRRGEATPEAMRAALRQITNTTTVSECQKIARGALGE